MRRLFGIACQSVDGQLTVEQRGLIAAYANKFDSYSTLDSFTASKEVKGVACVLSVPEKPDCHFTSGKTCYACVTTNSAAGNG